MNFTFGPTESSYKDVSNDLKWMSPAIFDLCKQDLVDAPFFFNWYKNDTEDFELIFNNVYKNNSIKKIFKKVYYKEEENNTLINFKPRKRKKWYLRPPKK